MNAIGDLLVKIKADTSDLEKGIASASKSMQNAGDSMVATGARLTAGVSAPLLGIGVAAIKAAADFETNMAVLKSVSSATSDEMKKMQQLAIALGNDLTIPGASASDAADAMVELAKAGLSVNDTMSAAKGVLQLAAAGELSTGEAATTAAAALNAFHLQGSEATRVADLLAAAANASAADVRGVGQSMQMAASVFASAKIPVQDLTTSIALLANSGLQGSDAGTSLKSMLIQLQSPTKKAQETMKQLGFSIYDANGNIIPMRDMVDKLSKSLSGMSQKQRDTIMNTLFSSDAIRSANIVLAGGVEAWDAMSGAVNKAGAANQLASARMEGLNGAFAALKNSIETLLLTAALPFMDTLKNIVLQVSSVITEIGNVNPQFLNAALAIGAVLAVAGPLTIAIGAIVGVIGTLLSPIGLVVLAVAGLSAAFASGIISVDAIKLKLTEFEPIFTSLSSIFQAFSALVQEVWVAILGVISPIIANINTFLRQHGAEIQTWLGDTWTRISGIIQTAIQIIHDIVVPILTAIGKFINEHSTEIQTFLSGAWQVISDTISGVLTFIQGLLQTVLKAINGDWEGAWETVKTTVSSVWEYIRKALDTVLGVIWGLIQLHLQNIVQDVQNKFNNALAIVQLVWDNIKTAIANRITETLNNVRTTFNNIKAAIVNRVTEIRDNVANFFAAIKNAIVNRITETRDNILNLFLAIKTGVINRITELKDNVVETFVRIKTAVINRFNETRDAVMNTAKNWVDRMIKAGEQLIQGLIDGIGAMKDKLVRAIGWIIDKAVQAVLDALGIHSPSRVFFDIGQNTMQGMINGIEDQRTNLMSLMDDVVSDMIDRFGGVDVTPGIQFGRVDNPYGVPGNVGIINPNTGIIQILPLPKPPEFVAPGIVGGGNGGPGGIGNIADGPKPIWLMTAAEWAERFGVSLAQAMIELANLQNQMLNPNLGLDPGRHDFAPPPGVIGGNYPGQLNPVLPPVIPVIPGPGNPIGPGGGIPTGPIPIGGITDAIEVINRAQAEIVRKLGEMNSVISNNLSQIGTKIVADSAGVAISYFNSGKQAMDFLVGGLEAGIPALMDELSKINRIMTAGIGNGNVPAAGKGQLSNNTSYNITVNNPVVEKAGDSIRRELFYLSAGVLA